MEEEWKEPLKWSVFPSNVREGLFVSLSQDTALRERI